MNCFILFGHTFKKLKWVKSKYIVLFLINQNIYKKNFKEEMEA